MSPTRAAVALALSCSLTCALGCVTAPRTTSLRLDANIDDATVTVDDQVLGSVKHVEKRGVALPPGKHRVTVEKAGFFPHDELLEVKEGDPLIRLKVVMERVPD
ncbi:MAG: PEGA domain-containing protein [Polyangiaceae bacterium]|nr:PEGA domain-containing protein [Polyangiaceae bacterium]